MHAKVRCNSNGISDFTLNTEYDVLGWILNGIPVAVVINDNGDVDQANTVSGPFDLVEVYATGKVV